jgi:hypothetical protein
MYQRAAHTAILNRMQNKCNGYNKYLLLQLQMFTRMKLLNGCCSSKGKVIMIALLMLLNLLAFLTPKKIDAYSACAIWDEANVPIQAQHVIQWHYFFGWHISTWKKIFKSSRQVQLHQFQVLAAAKTITFGTMR